MTDKSEVELELDPENAKLLEQDGIDADAIVNGLVELRRAMELLEGDDD